MHIQTFQGGYDQNFAYLLFSGKEAAIIDCFDAKAVFDYLKEHQLNLKYIISTHNHFDHIQGNTELKELTGAKIVMHSLNHCDLPVEEGSKLKLNDLELKILHTPGHTADSICILVNTQYLFTGDTLFVGCVGGHFYSDSKKTQPISLKRLMQLPENIQIFPGHHYGITPTSTIQFEKKHNPYCQNLI